MKGMEALSVLDIAQLENVTMNDAELMREVVGRVRDAGEPLVTALTPSSNA